MGIKGGTEWKNYREIYVYNLHDSTKTCTFHVFSSFGASFYLHYIIVVKGLFLISTVSVKTQPRINHFSSLPQQARYGTLFIAVVPLAVYSLSVLSLLFKALIVDLFSYFHAALIPAAWISVQPSPVAGREFPRWSWPTNPGLRSRH